MTAAPMTLEVLASDQHFDRQLALVREHWAAIRCLWLDSAVGLAMTRPTRDGRFEFVEDGLAAVIVPCCDTIPGILGTNPERHVEHLVDLVAVDIDHPDRFWRRRGDALVLGAAFLEIAGYEGEPVPVFKNPMSWLRSGGAGVVVLDWTWVRALLLGLELIAEDLDLAGRLEDALKPDIWVRRAAA